MFIKSKRVRLQMLIMKLHTAAPRSTSAGALELIETTLDQIEDAHSGVVKSQEHFKSRQTDDGRMYAPHASFEVASKYADCTCYRQARHKTYIRTNGAFRIVWLSAGNESVVLDKAGADGRRVSE